MSDPKLVWYKALELDELGEGRVKPVTLGGRGSNTSSSGSGIYSIMGGTTVAMTHFDGKYGALDNRCPHQGGPLGDGSIENGLLRCPWHGWDFCPHSGAIPGREDGGRGVRAYPVEVRKDGIYVGLPEPEMRDRTVSDVMVETLVEWGVRAVFGMVGHSNLGLADAVREMEEYGKLTYVGIRHEGAASFAASAYAKLTGLPAACMSIAGPGATNLLTGLWDAHVDRAPVIALTGQVATQFLGRHNFQELPLQEAFGQVATFSQTVLPGSRHAELVNLACKHAIGERGVAHLIVPDEVQTMKADDRVKVGSPDGRLAGSMKVAPNPDSLNQAAYRLMTAKRPVFIVGYGARDDMDAVVALADRLRAPVMTTFKAKGLIADSHLLACGVLGRSGTPIASYFMNEADVIAVFGASFSNHTGITPRKPIIQVDIDPMALGRNHPVAVPVFGDIGVTAGLLLEKLSNRVDSDDQRPEIAARWKIWREEKRRRLIDDRGRGISSAAVFDTMSRRLPTDAIIPIDVGNNAYSFGRYFECENHRVLMSGYLGSIGFALPAALGAWAATQETFSPFVGRKVVSVSGDGGFGQYMAEWTTAVKYGMPITHVLLNNGELGKISREQRAGEWPVWQTDLVNPPFHKYAEDCGARGFRVTTREELEYALPRALVYGGPSLVEVITDPELV